jgi:putative transposase
MIWTKKASLALVVLLPHPKARRPKMDVAFRRAIAEARRSGNLCFAGLLAEHRIEQAFGAARELWQGWIYTPAVTVWVFLAQCLSRDHSCRDAVAQLSAWRVAQGLKPCSPDTGAYCTAREDLPEEACHQLVRDTGCQARDEAAAAWLWLGRHVVVGDGSTITMADTPANQAEYPQMASQAAGCGFPIARIVVLFALSVGTVLEAAMGRYQGKQTGENSLFRTLHEALRPGDVLLADRCFSGWCDILLLLQCGVDVVVRKHQMRPTDFRRGRRLGKDDHLIVWKKSARPPWMTPEQYAELPEELTLREVRVRVPQRGFRTRQVVVVTTLLDAEQYPAEAIAQLYRRRWQAELNLRSLKIVLQMDHLRCKTPHRVRNEFFMHLVAYNLIRQTLAAAAASAGREPWTISFKGALQTVDHWLPVLHTTVSVEAWCQAVLTAIAAHRVGHRPDRIEPRVLKRRGKTYSLMIKPRTEYKKLAA